MAWRPGARHVLAHTSGSHLDVVDVDSGLRLARIQLPFVSGQIAWSADGSRLYANLWHRIGVYDVHGRRTGTIHMPGRATVTTFVPARTGHLVAVSRRDHVVSEVAIMGGNHDDVLFRGDASFTRLRFSPDGRWVLAAWPLADQWVFLRVGARGASRVITAANVSRRFKVRGFPQLEGWCCPP
jgi:sugar lactone lactonase YvrE